MDVITICDLLFGLGQQKSYGIARWFSDSIDKAFKYITTVKFNGVNALYRPWHMDFFVHGGRLYAIVQSNQMNADICLAYSDDFEHLTFYEKPLITNATIGKMGIYKPTAGVVGDSFYLYYTAQDIDNRALNKLYLTTINVSEII